MRRKIGVRWIVGTLLVAAIVGGCISAGFWQLRRLDARRANNDRVRARAAVVVDLPASGFSKGVDVDDLDYRRVEVRGTYDADHELLVRFRSRRGLPGYEVVTPLVTDDGALLVNRGWVPLDEGDRWPVAAAAPPTGEVTVEGVLVRPEGGAPRIVEPKKRGAPPVIAAVDPARLAGLVGVRHPYALPLLARGSAAAYPAPVDPPDLGEGPHLSYAVQWFLFATVGVVGWISLLCTRGPFGRRRRRPGRPATPEPTLPA